MKTATKRVRCFKQVMFVHVVCGHDDGWGAVRIDGHASDV